MVSVGTELLLGDTVDTNATHAGRVLAAHGITVGRRATVGDDVAAIGEVVGAALERTGLVLVCGGLGPTRDDRTRDAVAEVLGVPLAFDAAVWSELVARWQRIGRTIAESNRAQAMVPAGGTVLPNRWGSAPGLWIEHARGTVVLLPGVPMEFRNLLEHEVLPRLLAAAGAVRTMSRVLRTTGIPESRLGELVGPLEDAFAPVTVAYLPEQVGVDLRITAWQLAEDEASRALDRAEAALRQVAGPWIYATGTTDLADAVLAVLRARGLTLATAESCTGGLVGARVTAIAGSSEVYLGGVVSYADEAKATLLGVDMATLADHGAVSEQVAREMATGAAQRFGADVTVAVTGIAGPGGGSAEKPVGTVWFAWSLHGAVEAECRTFAGDRGQVRERAAQAALWGVLQRIGR
jgi:nicotinamide-nucleotide amidase